MVIGEDGIYRVVLLIILTIQISATVCVGRLLLYLLVLQYYFIFVVPFLTRIGDCRLGLLAHFGRRRCLGFRVLYLLHVGIILFRILLLFYDFRFFFAEVEAYS